MEKNIGRIWISLAIAVLVIVIWWQGDSLKAVPTKPGDEPFLIALTHLGILYIVALFVERALEVLIKAWRQGGKVQLEKVISTTQEDARAEPENKLKEYKVGTQRRALLAGLDRLGEAVEAALDQYQLQAVVKYMTWRARHLRPAHHQVPLTILLLSHRHQRTPLQARTPENQTMPTSSRKEFVNGLS